MSKNNGKSSKRSRRSFPDEFKEEAVQMLLDGHSASSVCQRLGLSGPNLLYRGKKEFLGRERGVASGWEQRVRELEAELRRVEREREILTAFLAHYRSTALSIFGRSG